MTDPLALPRSPRWREIAADLFGWLCIIALCGVLALILKLMTGEA